MSETNLPVEEKIETTFSFVETEHAVLDFWREKKIFKKSLEKTKNGPRYTFYDGPPFATGLPHHGHLVGGTLKDIVPRYFTMKGHYVERRFGWDCHGLPVEFEIDKKLGMSAHDAVKQLGVKKYNDECRGIVQLFTKEWEKTTERLGRWVDFENGYKTMDMPYMESVWFVLKRLWDMGLIYQGTRVVPFSTALGTSLSNFEAGSNYQDIQEPAITVLFKISNSEEYLAAWTTTPWTLPSNLALCVCDEMVYYRVKDEDKNIILVLAKDRYEIYAKNHKLTILSETTGANLVGTSYEPLFPFFKDLKTKGYFKVVSDDFVTTDSGTGIVHVAPAFGEDDNRVMKRLHLTELVCPVDDAGKFTSEVTTYKGMYIKDADKQIMRDLKADNVLYEQSTYQHPYPFCPRSDTPLIYKAIPSWYVNVEKIKDDLIAANKEINWVPDYIKEGRFGKWLEGARDWDIQRNRIWGTPLPIWKNDITEKTICFGSVADLTKATGKPLTDLHRENVDDLTFTKPGEQGVYRRVQGVLDCWFESGSMPYAQLHYPFENKEAFEKGFPAAFIAEGLDQTRGWFYTLTVLSAALFKKPAFLNVIVNGIVVTEEGKKMSKRLRNYTAPDALMETHGADAFRLYLINSGLVRAEELRFSDAGVKDMVRRALLPWYNCFKFFHTYAQVDGWSPKSNFIKGDNILDQWCLSKLQTLIDNVTAEMESYRLYNVVPSLFEFIEDLTNWYIRLNRRRFWDSGLTPDKCAAYSTLYTAILTLSKAMAPFAPFLSEHIFQELKKLGNLPEESVHLCSYPMADKSLIDTTLEIAVSRMQQVILLGRQKRIQSSIKVKTPLQTLTIIHRDETLLNGISKVEEYIRSELNIKEIRYSTDEEKFIRLYAKPNSPVLGPRFGKTFGKFVGLISKLSAAELFKLENGESIVLDTETFTSNDVLIYREGRPGTQSLSNRFISIDLDITLTKELREEGMAREVVNRIQKMRKDLDFNVSDRIEIFYEAHGELVTAITANKSYVADETLALTITAGDHLKDKGGQEHEIDGHGLYLMIKRCL